MQEGVQAGAGYLPRRLRSLPGQDPHNTELSHGCTGSDRAWAPKQVPGVLRRPPWLPLTWRGSTVWPSRLSLAAMLPSCRLGLRLRLGRAWRHWGQEGAPADLAQHRPMQAWQKLCPQSSITGLRNRSKQMAQVASSCSSAAASLLPAMAEGPRVRLPAWLCSSFAFGTGRGARGGSGASQLRDPDGCGTSPPCLRDTPVTSGPPPGFGTPPIPSRHSGAFGTLRCLWDPTRSFGTPPFLWDPPVALGPLCAFRTPPPRGFGTLW